MKPKSSKDMSQLEDMIEYLRKELNSLVVGSEKLYRSERILELSKALDQVIVEYMKLTYSTKR